MPRDPLPRDPAPRLLFTVTEDWYFLAHRLNLALAARDAGYRVGVVTRVGGDSQRIACHGFELFPLAWRRGALRPDTLLAEALSLARLYRRLAPDLVHHVSLRPILAGSWAALAAGVPARLDAVTGLGTLFTVADKGREAIGGAVLRSLAFTQKRGNAVTLVENGSDRAFLAQRLGLGPQAIALNPGSGRDLRRYRPLPLPDNDPPVIACAARLLRLKGVADLVAASRIARANGSHHRLVIAGMIDPENPNAIPESEVRSWNEVGAVEWVGELDDVRPLWSRADVAALASHGGEGVPLSLVEAAASGRPLLSTRVAGNSDIARDGVNALLAPPRDPPALAEALARLVGDSALRRRFAAASLAVAADFSDEIVIPKTLALYERLLAQAKRR